MFALMVELKEKKQRNIVVAIIALKIPAMTLSTYSSFCML
jgi:hypothetical protein